MSGPAGVTALVLAETVAGGLALVFVTPLWNEVRRGFFVLTCSILALFSAAVWGSVSAGRVTGDDAGTWSLRLAFALTFVLLAVVVLLLVRRGTWARFVGYAAAPLAVGMLGAMAGTADGSWLVAFLQLLAGAAFLGAVLDGLLLGHWYLTDRGLTRTPINRYTNLLLVGVALEASALVLGGFGPTEATPEFNPLLTSAGLASWIALGMVAATALIGVMIRITLRGPRASAVQAATGFFYLAVITATTAEFAAKVGFLG
ncbi:MAG TPA: hypothetical protein VFZ50_01970 [Actinomycetota bacterium]|jgi:hypothetical protein|nr:hypothetical protein [Actinomycetota bacterium]